MKRAKCASGEIGWQCRLRHNYSSFDDWQAYCNAYNLHTRLGYTTPYKAWLANPVIQGSTNPADYRKVKAAPGTRRAKQVRHVWVVTLRVYVEVATKPSEGRHDEETTEDLVLTRLGFFKTRKAAEVVAQQCREEVPCHYYHTEKITPGAVS